jgi:hypothetical protein
MLLGSQLSHLKKTKDTDDPWLFVRINDDESFQSFPGNINPYGLPSKACSQEVICMGTLDKLARAFHYNYLRNRVEERKRKRKSKGKFVDKDADKWWKDLAQEYRDSNRKAADHIAVKLRGIECKIVDVDKSKKPATLTPSEIEELAILEHSRWSAERTLAGWSYGRNRDEASKKNPDLTNWMNLSPTSKEYDRNSIRNIPEVLKHINKAVDRI